MLVTWYVDKNHHFLTLKNRKKLHIYTRGSYLLAENQLLPIFMILGYSLCIMNFPEISRAHCDIVVTSYKDGWYLYWYQRQEETRSYTLVVNIRL